MPHRLSAMPAEFVQIGRLGAEEHRVPDVQDMAGVLQRRVQVMGDHHNSDAIFVIELLNECIHFRCHLGIKAGDRFIQKQHFLRGAQGAGEQDPLLLAAGERPVAALGKGLICIFSIASAVSFFSSLL